MKDITAKLINNKTQEKFVSSMATSLNKINNQITEELLLIMKVINKIGGDSCMKHLIDQCSCNNCSSYNSNTVLNQENEREISIIIQLNEDSDDNENNNEKSKCIELKTSSYCDTNIENFNKDADEDVDRRKRGLRLGEKIGLYINVNNIYNSDITNNNSNNNEHLNIITNDNTTISNLNSYYLEIYNLFLICNVALENSRLDLFLRYQNIRKKYIWRESSQKEEIKVDIDKDNDITDNTSVKFLPIHELISSPYESGSDNSNDSTIDKRGDINCDIDISMKDIERDKGVANYTTASEEKDTHMILQEEIDRLGSKNLHPRHVYLHHISMIIALTR